MFSKTIKKILRFLLSTTNILFIMFMVVIIMILNNEGYLNIDLRPSLKENFVVKINDIADYRSKNLTDEESAQAGGNTIKLYDNMIKDNTIGMQTNGIYDSDGNEIVAGLNLDANSSEFKDIIANWKKYVDARILTLTMDGSLDPSKPTDAENGEDDENAKKFLDTIDEINELTEFRNNAIFNNNEFISAWEQSQK